MYHFVGHNLTAENDTLLPSLTTIQGEKVEEEEKQQQEQQAQQEQQEQQEPLESIQSVDPIAPYRKAAKKLTSVHLLRYNNHLRRLYNIVLLPSKVSRIFLCDTDRQKRQSYACIKAMWLMVGTKYLQESITISMTLLR